MARRGFFAEVNRLAKHAAKEQQRQALAADKNIKLLSAKPNRLARLRSEYRHG